ncbi:ATP-binding cassette domain-containing protein [Aquiluna sp. Uisw_065]|jgi:ABC-type multidrug transport system ATPase subunit|uniref:ABC transporter ATP-binding protein n=1 Tax=Aquiluna sp. Uisw_065 TaxID=3230967 RepID=UPI003591C623
MPQSLELAIKTSSLTKQFGSQKAVSSIDLSVPKGSVFGFLGPNGSGKTTTIRMILGLAAASKGEIELLGHPIPKELEHALPKVGALVEGPAFYPYMSGRNNLIRIDSADRNSTASTRKKRVDAALERVGLTNAAKKKVHAYSLGMKQRLGLANALLKPREILILDEPTNGLDPQGTREVRNLIRSLAAEGITIFVSSHLLSEIEQLCSHLAVMTAGKIVAQGSLAELRNESQTRLVLKADRIDELVDLLKTQGLTKLSLKPDRVVVPVPSDFDVASLNQLLVKKKFMVSEIRLEQPSLEEYFVNLTGEGFEVVR